MLAKFDEILWPKLSKVPFWVLAKQPTVHSGIVCGGRSVAVAVCRSDRWHVTGDMRHMTCNMRHVTYDKWQITIFIFFMFLIVSVRFGMGATIRTRWENQCLPYAGFSMSFSHPTSVQDITILQSQGVRLDVVSIVPLGSSMAVVCPIDSNMVVPLCVSCLWWQVFSPGWTAWGIQVVYRQFHHQEVGLWSASRDHNNFLNAIKQNKWKRTDEKM